MLKNRVKEPNMFQMYLPNILNLSHPLCKLADSIDWNDLHEDFKELYCEDFGRPAKSVHLMVGLHYLKYLKNLSDEEIVALDRKSLLAVFLWRGIFSNNISDSSDKYDQVAQSIARLSSQ